MSFSDASWRDAAACLAVDNELFFPIGTVGPALGQVAEAKAVCQRCPVCEPCLRWALDNHQDHGIWGGTTEAERRSMRRDAAAVTPAVVVPPPLGGIAVPPADALAAGIPDGGGERATVGR